MNFILNLVPNKILRFFLALSDSQVPCCRPTYLLKATRNFWWNTPEHLFEGTGVYLTRQPGAVGPGARKEQEPWEWVRRSLTLIPQTVWSPEAEPARRSGLCRWQPRRAPARGMGLGVRAPRKRASDKQPRPPGRIPKGCCPAAQRSGRSPALSQKTEPQLYSSSIPASIKAICPILTACQRAKLDPFRRMKTSATDF